MDGIGETTGGPGASDTVTDSGIGTGSSGLSGQWSASSGQDTASTITNGTITNGTFQNQSQRSGSSGVFSSLHGGSSSLTSSNLHDLGNLPKLDMIELFLRPESQTYRDEKKANRLQMRPDQTITELQKEVHKATGVHPGQQYLLHEDTRTVLSDRNMATKTIRSCNIIHRSWLKYSARSRGGGGNDDKRF